MIITLVSVFTAAVVFYAITKITRMLPKWISVMLRVIAFSAFILFLAYLIDFTAEIIQDYKVEKEYIQNLTYRIDSLQKVNDEQTMQIQTLIRQDSFFNKELTYAFD